MGSMIVVLVLVITIGLSTSLLSINDLQSSYSSGKNEEAVDLLEGCIEDALMRINQKNSLPGSIPLLGSTCSVTLNSHVGTNWDFTLGVIKDGYSKKIQIKLTRGTIITINSWGEVP